MSGTSSVPKATFGPAGFVAPAESEILAGVQADTNAAMGGGLNPALETPQGQLASSLTAIIGDKNDQFLKYVSQVDPAFAEGRMQDGIARIYFLERDPARPTVAAVSCGGLAGVVIGLGALIQAGDGNVYSCTQAGIIPAGGAVSLTFACLTNGPIACPAQRFQIYQTIPGWDTAISTVDGVLGNLVEGRAAFEERRAASVALNGHGSVQSIKAAVLAVSDVLDAYVIDNVKSDTVTIGTVPLKPHSIYVAALGGDNQAIADAIWSKKDTGCDYNGNTIVTVYDDTYDEPRPSYETRFHRPDLIPIIFRVRIKNSASVPSTALGLIQAAIVSAFAGGDDGPRERIAGVVYASRYYAPVALLGAWARIIDIQVSRDGTNYSDTVPMDIDEAPVVSGGTVGMVLV